MARTRQFQQCLGANNTGRADGRSIECTTIPLDLVRKHRQSARHHAETPGKPNSRSRLGTRIGNQTNPMSLSSSPNPLLRSLWGGGNVPGLWAGKHGGRDPFQLP